MKLTAGEIYFVRERDIKSGEVTPYVKIGIVREGAKGPRTSEERLLEHQTGNPRELFLHEVIATPAVEEIETRLHRAFAEHGVSGEWFLFDDALIEAAVAKTKNLAAEAQAHLFALEQAELLKKELANGSTAPASDEAIRWHAVYVEANEIIKIASGLKKSFQSLVIESVDDLEEVEHILTQQVRTGASFFNIDRFAQMHPDIYAKYEFTETTFYQRFKVQTPNAKDFSLRDANPEAWEYLDTFSHMLEIVPESVEDQEALHGQYLRVLGIESEALWKKQISEAQLKTLCGPNAAIESICTWPRENKERLVFDEDAFKSENAKLYAEFLDKRDDVEVTLVDPKRSY
jgi:T5orf172 domain